MDNSKELGILTENIREYERSLISDMGKINSWKEEAAKDITNSMYNLGSLVEMEIITRAQIHACRKILKMVDDG